MAKIPHNLYVSAERKLTGVIVAIPFFLVTSYLLYNRVFLGVERRVPLSIESLEKATSKTSTKS